MTSRNRSRLGAVVVGVALAVGLGGCSFVTAPPVPFDDREAVAVGTNMDVGEIKIRSLLLVTTGEGQPGRFLGSIFNPTDAAVEVTIADDDDSVTVTVPARDVLGFDEEETVIDSVAEIPGSYTPVTVTAEGVEVEDRIPVVDGSLDWYQPYVPGGS
ncbi:hypothetical protein ACFWN7_10125 [Agromyces sp. NPDC058484]|uniref:hypothetical protein n=1 Tax=Agromyces sp. NPDC058484 TaxID=3346524 RepID=UPI00364BD274